jgi:membrane protein DedA with SNARE-associated domain
VQPLLDWLSSLPPFALYAALAVTAAAENVFPPLPADTVVAFGSFLAARGHGTAIGSFLATWIGNIAGAMAMYFAGRKLGAERVIRRLGGGDRAQQRLQLLYGRHGVWALSLSRFLPGVRALVPPFAGALRVPPLLAGAAIALASGAWYGAITYFAFRVGASWAELSQRVGTWAKGIGLAAVALAAVVAVVWWLRRRRR